MLQKSMYGELVKTWHAPGREDIAENYFGMTCKPMPENGRFKLDIIQEDNRPGGVQDDPQGEENPLLQS